ERRVHPADPGTAQGRPPGRRALAALPGQPLRGRVPQHRRGHAGAPGDVPQRVRLRVDADVEELVRGSGRGAAVQAALVATGGLTWAPSPWVSGWCATTPVPGVTRGWGSSSS